MKKKFREIEVDGKQFTWSVEGSDYETNYIKIWSVTNKGKKIIFEGTPDYENDKISITPRDIRKIIKNLLSINL